MTLIPGICTQCGATLSVEQDKDCMICPYCSTPFITEKAIQNFNTTYNITNNIATQNVYVQGVNSDFVIEGGRLVKYTGSDVDVVVPENVLAIGRYAFANTMIKSILLPSKLQKIEDYVFIGCENLEIIKLPDSVTTLWQNCFSGLIGLKILDMSQSKISSFPKHYLDEQMKEIRISDYTGQHIVEQTEVPFISKSNVTVYVDDHAMTLDEFYTDYKRTSRMKHNRCTSCNGEFTKGFFNYVCERCGKKKDY